VQHETVVIRGDVHIAESAIIEPYAVITGPAWIKANAYVGAHAVIGAPPQHRGSYPSPIDATIREAGVVVGRGACVREYATIHQGILVDTIVGEDALLMAGVHIAHDSLVADRVTIGSFSVLGGFTVIDQDATLGQGVVTHPWTLIGESAMIGLNSSVVRDVMPFSKVAGSPAKLIGTNTHKAPDLPSSYTETMLGASVWELWAERCRMRDELRAAWDKHE